MVERAVTGAGPRRAGRLTGGLAALAVLAPGTLACGGVAAWAMTAGLEAKQCLDGELHPAQAGMKAASITERGCEVTTGSGELTVLPISGPPFEAGVAGVLGFVVLGALTAAVLVGRGRRRRQRVARAVGS